MRSEYDIVIIGGGAVGFSAATAAADSGASVLLVSRALSGEPALTSAAFLRSPFSPGYPSPGKRG